MKRLVIKLLLSAAAFVGANWGICGYAAAKGAPTFLPWKIGIPLLIVLFQVFIVLNACICPLETKKQKRVYLCVSEVLFALTAAVWGTVIIPNLLA